MKIGAFANQFNMNPSAVRFYIDKALLTPKLEQSQYVFDEACVQQMKQIIAYKDCGLSLEDIGTLLYYKSATGLKDPDVRDEAARILQNKYHAIRQDIKEKEEACGRIGRLIKKLDRRESESENASFQIPLDGISLLYCPKCQLPLKMSKAEITASGVSSGMLSCDCGYHASIDNGLIICKGSSDDSPLKAFDNVDFVIATTDDFSNSYRTLFEKSQLWIYQQICVKAADSSCALAGPFTWNFLVRYINLLPSDCVYLIIDPSIRKLRKIQRYLADANRKTVIIAGDIKEIPVQHRCVDLFIDDFSTSNALFAYNRPLISDIQQFLSESCKVIGHFVDYSNAPKSLENFKRDHPDFDPGLMNLKKIYYDSRSAYRSHAGPDLKLSEVNTIGSTTGKQKDFARQIGDETVTVVAYTAEASEVK